MLQMKFVFVTVTSTFTRYTCTGLAININESQRGPLYTHFSQTFCYKQYLDYVDVEKFRHA